MGNYTIFGAFEILGEAGKQEILQQLFRSLDLKSSSEQIFSKNCRWVPLGFRAGAKVIH